MNAPANIDPLVCALSRMAFLELALAKSRRLWVAESKHAAFTSARKLAELQLAEVDRLLDGTIHSFSNYGARR